VLGQRAGDREDVLMLQDARQREVSDHLRVVLHERVRIHQCVPGDGRERSDLHQAARIDGPSDLRAVAGVEANADGLSSQNAGIGRRSLLADLEVDRIGVVDGTAQRSAVRRERAVNAGPE
jgi:hypothetical protein